MEPLSAPAPVAESATPAVPETDVPAGTDGCVISVIIPVYNTMPYLTELLNSLEAQDLDKKRFEVIAVNDGSTDYSGEILDVYAKRNQNFRVVHQENSGWPGKPRNVGIDVARGEYVFFCDGDDVLGREALRRMADYAQRHDVDILIPKMVGLGGRKVMSGLYRATRLDTPLEVALRSLNPIKLIRRSIMVEQGIRFKEEPVRLEDGMAVTEAYMAAGRISILADYDYYQARSRSDGQNISIRLIEPLGYVGSLSEIARIVTEHVADAERARQLVAALFIRKGLRFYEGKRFLDYDDEGRGQWMSAHAQLLDRFLPGDTTDMFDGVHRVRVDAIRAGRLDELVKLAEADLASARNPDLVTLDASASGVRVQLRSYATDRTARDLVIEDRDTGQKTGVPLVAGGDGLLIADLDSAALAAALQRLGNVWLSYNTEATDLRRVAMDGEIPAADSRKVRYYRTAHGFFSIDVRKAG
ncbi:glycosyltransferase family 2 protein [Paeniglutamicibacter sp. MACA_103]|uniref:glycosyltransferase family 2 protein n=1 Tax=Paeniglutamicibacter sp. MACA_103 TaxID=3377337 RepID=UPI0038955D77